MKAEHNQLLTRIGPGTDCGALLRHYWQPAALLDEFDARLDPRMAQRPLKALRLLGQDLVLWRDALGRFSLLDRDCAHRGADLAFAQHEGDGLRCAFHGWKYDAAGTCLETPAEPRGSTLCRHVRQRSYPVREQSGVLFAWLGPQGSTPGVLPPLDCFAAPPSHSVAVKVLWHCNWLQAFELGIDPAHPFFAQREPQDGGLPQAEQHKSGRPVRASRELDLAGERGPMTRVMREACPPEIRLDNPADGVMRLIALRSIDAQRVHVRITQALFPHTVVMPLSPTLTLTQMHVPVDDTHTCRVSFFTSFGAPLDHETMRQQRLQDVCLPDGVPQNGRHNGWRFDVVQPRTRTVLDMDDVDLNEQWAVESMGVIQDRTREHLGTSDKAIMAHRRALLKAIDAVRLGGQAPLALNAEQAADLRVPGTLDCVAPAQDWQRFCQDAMAAKRAAATWLQGAVAD